MSPQVMSLAPRPVILVALSLLDKLVVGMAAGLCRRPGERVPPAISAIARLHRE